MSFLGFNEDMNGNSKHTVHEAYTYTISNNAFNPVFQNCKHMDLVVHFPEGAFVLVEVPECGIGVIPIASIRKGYRVLPLVNDRFVEKNSMILFKV